MHAENRHLYVFLYHQIDQLRQSREEAEAKTIEDLKSLLHETLKRIEYQVITATISEVEIINALLLMCDLPQMKGKHLAQCMIDIISDNLPSNHACKPLAGKSFLAVLLSFDLGITLLAENPHLTSTPGAFNQCDANGRSLFYILVQNQLAHAQLLKTNLIWLYAVNEETFWQREVNENGSPSRTFAAEVEYHYFFNNNYLRQLKKNRNEATKTTTKSAKQKSKLEHNPRVESVLTSMKENNDSTIASKPVIKKLDLEQQSRSHLVTIEQNINSIASLTGLTILLSAPKHLVTPETVVTISIKGDKNNINIFIQIFKSFDKNFVLAQSKKEFSISIKLHTLYLVIRNQKLHEVVRARFITESKPTVVLQAQTTTTRVLFDEHTWKKEFLYVFGDEANIFFNQPQSFFDISLRNDNEFNLRVLKRLEAFFQKQVHYATIQRIGSTTDHLYIRINCLVPIPPSLTFIHNQQLREYNQHLAIETEEEDSPVENEYQYEEYVSDPISTPVKPTLYDAKAFLRDCCKPLFVDQPFNFFNELICDKDGYMWTTTYHAQSVTALSTSVGSKETVALLHDISIIINKHIAAGTIEASMGVLSFNWQKISEWKNSADYSQSLVELNQKISASIQPTVVPVILPNVGSGPIGCDQPNSINFYRKSNDKNLTLFAVSVKKKADNWQSLRNKLSKLSENELKNLTEDVQELLQLDFLIHQNLSAEQQAIYFKIFILHAVSLFITLSAIVENDNNPIIYKWRMILRHSASKDFTWANLSQVIAPCLHCLDLFIQANAVPNSVFAHYVRPAATQSQPNQTEGEHWHNLMMGLNKFEFKIDPRGESSRQIEDPLSLYQSLIALNLDEVTIRKVMLGNIVVNATNHPNKEAYGILGHRFLQKNMANQELWCEVYNKLLISIGVKVSVSEMKQVSTQKTTEDTSKILNSTLNPNSKPFVLPTARASQIHSSDATHQRMNPSSKPFTMQQFTTEVSRVNAHQVTEVKQPMNPNSKPFTPSFHQRPIVVPPSNPSVTAENYHRRNGNGKS